MDNEEGDTAADGSPDGSRQVSVGTYRSEAYQDFNAREYLEIRYQDPRTSDPQQCRLKMLQCYYNFYSKMKLDPSSSKQLDFGCGPTIHSVISACPFVKEITCCDFAQSARDEILKWKNETADCFNWSNYIKFVVRDIEGNDSDAEPELREKELKRKISYVLPCDARSEDMLDVPPGTKYDVIISHGVIESIAESREEFITMIARFLRYLNEGGYVILTVCINLGVWTSGGLGKSKTVLHGFPISFSEVDELIKEAGYRIEDSLSVKAESSNLGHFDGYRLLLLKESLCKTSASGVYDSKAFEDFNAREYLELRYQHPGTSDPQKCKAKLLQCYYNFYRKMQDVLDPSSSRMMEYACGPSIHAVISACPFVKEITCCDFAQSARDEILKWKNETADCFNWSNYIKFVVRDIEGNDSDTEPELRERELKKKITEVLPCDIRSEKLLDLPLGTKYDVISVCGCMEAVAETREEYVCMTSKFRQHLKKNGFVILVVCINVGVWSTGGIDKTKNLYSFKVSFSEVDEIVKEAGYTIKDSFSVKAESANLGVFDGYKAFLLTDSA